MSESTSSRRGLVETDRVAIERQIKLPWSKAVEISYKSVKIRFWRSLITASGIVLAITFLMSTLTSGTTTASMKIGIPTRIVELKRAQAEAKAKVMGMRATLSPDADTVKRFSSALQAEDIKLAHNILSTELKDHPDRLAQAGPLQGAMNELLKVSGELEYMSKMRLKMITEGESVSMSDTEAPTADSAGALMDKDQEEAKSRDTWLIALALLVALVGIMNSMLMSVTERFREIGTMKCLGALDSFIVKIFLIESSMMGFLGTTFGILLGLAMSLGKLWWGYGGTVFGFVPGGDLGMRVLVALAVGTGLAFAGAIVPAMIAARMEPVAAMRVDQ
ncbi:MAG: hypothetical protein KIS92_20715 [Planctomycetota bacterium]|nr:hypothetical protein [Planctomycetota bacterium]